MNQKHIFNDIYVLRSLIAQNIESIKFVVYPTMNLLNNPFLSSFKLSQILKRKNYFIVCHKSG